MSFALQYADAFGSCTCSSVFCFIYLLIVAVLLTVFLLHAAAFAVAVFAAIVMFEIAC